MYLFLPLWHTHTNLLTRLSVIVTLDINKILTPQRSIETQSKFIFGHKLNHFELARVAKCWWCTEITLGGGPLCMHNVSSSQWCGTYIEALSVTSRPPPVIRRLALDRRSILNAVLIAKNTFKTGRQERGFICSVTRISVELLPTVPHVNLKVALTLYRVRMN